MQVKRRLLALFNKRYYSSSISLTSRYVTISRQLPPPKNGDAMMSQSPSKLRRSALIALVVGL